ncbi:hypothetical protein RclHR1_00230002 [Rhizophagus clarus]|uniref:Uncharacterized protein n=1 Tax=Rhizophagus clarus TaxID=94130 RepID=A0A2Z6R8K1_9GLOM|nr:hypothetical protein RclHR1_00230002 [Rhizophagus clarus]GES72905.1 hypothetical protein RCL_jg15556.t1 [Rhizophagus clarus]
MLTSSKHAIGFDSGRSLYPLSTSKSKIYTFFLPHTQQLTNITFVMAKMQAKDEILMMLHFRPTCFKYKMLDYL